MYVDKYADKPPMRDVVHDHVRRPAVNPSTASWTLTLSCQTYMHEIPSFSASHIYMLILDRGLTKCLHFDSSNFDTANLETCFFCLSVMALVSLPSLIVSTMRKTTSFSSVESGIQRQPAGASSSKHTPPWLVYCVTGDPTQGFRHASQPLYHVNYTPAPQLPAGVRHLLPS